MPTHCYPDHEAVSALLRVSSSRVDDTLVGAMGDFSSRRPTHTAEDAVRAVKFFLISQTILDLFYTWLQVGEGLQLVNAALR